MKTTAYRLDQYKIIELDHGELYWESYASFARTISGKCFIKGNILFISPFNEISEPGFLIMEYNQFLEKLPRWTKTKYYCCNYSIKNTSDGKALTKAEMNKWSRESMQNPGVEFKKNIMGDPDKKPVPASYQLGKYEITEDENGGFVWKIFTGLDRLKAGKCFIEENVIFIGDGKTLESEVSKDDYIKHLAELPPWTKTVYYCDRYTLKSCQTDQPSSVKEISGKYAETPLPKSVKVAGATAGSVSEKQKSERKALSGKFRPLKPDLLKVIRGYRFPINPGFKDRLHRLKFFSPVSSKNHRNWFIGGAIFLTAVSFLAGGAILIFSIIDDDKHKNLFRHGKSYGRSYDDPHRENRHTMVGAVSPAEISKYKHSCGGCHFAYTPDLLPSRSWQKLITGLGDHFGEVVALDPDSKKMVAEHLTQNAAEYSTEKHSKRIMESLTDKSPTRITDISYIQHKHRKISPLVFDRKSVGSLSNCPACHKTAEQGNYKDDEVEIPR